MSELAPETRRRLEAAAHKHGFSFAAALCLHRALAAGNGMAQFSHSELGGLGQWAGGGMTMIGKMGNPELRRRVGALCVELAALHPVPDLVEGGLGADRIAEPGAPTSATRQWWPAGLGTPSSSGVPAWTAPRVVDAGMTNTTDACPGPAAPAGADVAHPTGEESGRVGTAAAFALSRPDDPLAMIDRLAGLRASGILTDQEFVAKKIELLGRL
jgi:hypothetical protein